MPAAAGVAAGPAPKIARLVMPRFLPRSIQDYAIPRREPADFTPADAALLDDIGRKMNVDKARSEGRIPSPFSRSFVFYLNLHGKGLRGSDTGGSEETPQLDRGRELLQAEARRTFRGICATFAFRKALGLDIRQTAVLLNPAGRLIERVLVTTIDAAPRGKDHWNPLRFFTIQPSLDSDPEVLAGLSPLTALAPAARQPRRLTALYWYDPGEPGTDGTARWYDPTTAHLSEDDTFRLNPLTAKTVARYLRAWATKAVESLASPTALEAFGLTPSDSKLLQLELRRWLADMGGELREEGLVDSEAIPGAQRGQKTPPFLEYVCKVATGELLGDLPLFRERLLVTREQLLDPAVRLYGRTFGNPLFADMVERLPRHGGNLGTDLGLGPYQVPVEYLVVDQLFTPKLVLVTEKGFSNEWEGLEIDGAHYLLPFHPEILELLSPDELVAATTGQRDRKEENYIVSLRFGEHELEIPQLYSIAGQGEYIVDADTIPPEHLDIRVFPNFDLDSVGETPDSNPLAAEDRKYYARVRVNPVWDFEISPFRYNGPGSVETQFGSVKRLGSAKTFGEPGQYHPGQVLLFTLDQKPSGLFVEERGLCLLHLPVAKGTPATWEVGVDFGTSNTCVTYRTEADASPKIVHFPVLTTTLLRVPQYSAEFPGPRGSTVNEGASALLDFFFKQQDADKMLTSNAYFPTQIVTRHTEVRPEWAWEHEGGLIFFKNISLADRIVWELISGYPTAGSSEGEAAGLRHEKAFRVKQDIKWEHTSWLTVFMEHLRKQVLMAAARQRSTVRRTRFSYPKAFSLLQQEDFEDVLNAVWNPSAEANRLSTHSESEAVRNFIAREADEYVVFDVGGGTTDLIGFSTHEPIFQTSFKLAAGHINRYVRQSAAFRTAFLHAFTEKLKINLPPAIDGQFQLEESAAGEEFLTTVWLGLLEVTEGDTPATSRMRDILSALRRLEGPLTDPRVKAVHGFFLSITLLFGGLAYYAGLLMRTASQGTFDGRKFDHRRFVDLVLTGNGGKLFNMVDHPKAPFKPVIQGMFLSGLGAADEQPPQDFSPGTLEQVGFDGLFMQDGLAAPKVTVALGLLKPPPAATGEKEKEIPLANILGEDGYSLGGKPAGHDASLVAFYREVHSQMREFDPPSESPRQLSRCLDALNRLLPNGMNGELPVIPRAGEKWHRTLLDRLYPRSRRHIRSRIVQNASVLTSDLKNNRVREGKVPAQEPLFIVELAALLDAIRGEYA